MLSDIPYILPTCTIVMFFTSCCNCSLLGLSTLRYLFLMFIQSVICYTSTITQNVNFLLKFNDFNIIPPPGIEPEPQHFQCREVTISSRVGHIGYPAFEAGPYTYKMRELDQSSYP